MRVRPLLLLFLFLLCLSVLFGCSPGPQARQVEILADGKSIPLSTSVLTVREALAEARVTLDADDRVQPDLWVELDDEMTIRVIRVQEDVIVERNVLPYRQQTVKSEALPAGQQKLVQAGKNGQVEITYRLQFEDGVEVARSVLRTITIKDPVPQITVVGVEGMVDAVEIQGTIAYLNDGNAWIMRGSSGGRHPVTNAGNLDGRAFALSPDGSYLLYSVITETVEFDGPFNELYLLDLTLLDQEPFPLPIQNVLWAGWSPDGAQIAYTTGEKSGPPGWKARNDLWLASPFDDEGELAEVDPKLVIQPQTSGTYSWWGTRYEWSPDGQKVAYARPDQVGWLDVSTKQTFLFASFAPLDTAHDWVWVPAPSWSPDSWFVACTIHGEEQGRSPEESQHFEVWALGIDKVIRARLTQPVGMWSTPRWSPARGEDSLIAFVEADTPFNSAESRYTLKVMDRDGSNKRDVFPAENEAGISRPVIYDWSPDGSQIVVLYLGDLHLIDLQVGLLQGGGRSPIEPVRQQLTGDGRCTLFDWSR